MADRIIAVADIVSALVGTRSYKEAFPKERVLEVLADQRDRGSRITDDLSGLVLGCGACFSAVYGLDRAQQTSWTSTSTVSWLALGGIAAVLFVVWTVIKQVRNRKKETAGAA